MKRWKCTVCGYIHTGEEPPDECPVCGADKSMFVEIDENDVEIEKTQVKDSDLEPKKAAGWKCTVCGYKHTEDRPPEECPVCGSEKNKFSAIKEDKEDSARIDTLQSKPQEKDSTQKEEPPRGEPTRPEEPEWLIRLRALSYPPWLDRLTGEMTRMHAHPISVHIPNGVLPVSFLFMVLAMAFGSRSVSHAAFYNWLVVMLSMPIVLFSGYNDWQRRYGGRMTKIFRIKITCGVIVLTGTVLLFLWWVILPEIITPGTAGRWLFLLIAAATIGAAVTAGFFGGKLVFPKNDS